MRPWWLSVERYTRVSLRHWLPPAWRILWHDPGAVCPWHWVWWSSGCCGHRSFSTVALPAVLLEDATAAAFGEAPRHELNNPLTGILGNAELLLAEVRRKNDGQLPNGGQQRLETIAALAVPLRETVRRLSQDWETHNRIPQRAVPPRMAH
jgi:hypothetical protein